MASMMRPSGLVLLLLSSVLQITLAQDSCPGAPTFPDTLAVCNGWHTVVSGDTCSSLEQKFNITSQEFLRWNPSVSADCLTNFWLGEAYCVRVGVSQCTTSVKTSSAAPTSSSSSSAISSTITSSVNATYSTRWPVTSYNLTTTTAETAWPPTHTQAGQPSYCISWYLVNSGDSCQSIVNRYGATLSMDNFLAWNPSLDQDCSGLFVGWWVCVSIQSQTSVTLEWSTSATNASTPSPTAYTPTSWPPADSSFTAVPIQSGVPSSCQAYYLAQPGDTCRIILAEYSYVSQDEFMSWNPALAGNCDGLLAGFWYCVANFASSLPMPATVTTIPTPTGTGSPSNCAAWYFSTVNEDCDDVVTQFGTFSKSDFITWNPSVWSDCSNYQEAVYYCVAVPGTPTTRTAPSPSITVPPSTPTQAGMVVGCTTLWLVSDTDTCDSITRANGILLTDFLTWNPALGSNSTTCTPTADFYVCVGAPGAGSTGSGVVSTSGPSQTATGSTTSHSVPATTSASQSVPPPASSTSSGPAGAVSTPSPVQPGMVAGCVRFYYVESGDGCFAISTSAGIDLNTFYKWNPGVSTDCSTMWLNSYVCIGISGPATTITSGTAVPAPTS